MNGNSAKKAWYSTWAAAQTAAHQRITSLAVRLPHLSIRPIKSPEIHVCAIPTTTHTIPARAAFAPSGDYPNVASTLFRQIGGSLAPDDTPPGG